MQHGAFVEARDVSLSTEACHYSLLLACDSLTNGFSGAHPGAVWIRFESVRKGASTRSLPHYRQALTIRCSPVAVCVVCTLLAHYWCVVSCQRGIRQVLTIRCTLHVTRYSLTITSLTIRPGEAFLQLEVDSLLADAPGMRLVLTIRSRFAHYSLTIRYWRRCEASQWNLNQYQCSSPHYLLTVGSLFTRIACDRSNKSKHAKHGAKGATDNGSESSDTADDPGPLTIGVLLTIGVQLVKIGVITSNSGSLFAAHYSLTSTLYSLTIQGCRMGRGHAQH